MIKMTAISKAHIVRTPREHEYINDAKLIKTFRYFWNAKKCVITAVAFTLKNEILTVV